MAEVTGLTKIRHALQNTTKETAKNVEIGLKKAGLFLQRESMKIVPVDTGYLRSGCQTRATGKEFNTKVHVFYTADYAIYVHEDLVTRRRNNKQPKYLENPARANRDRMARIILNEVGIQ